MEVSRRRTLLKVPELLTIRDAIGESSHCLFCMDGILANLADNLEPAH